MSYMQNYRSVASNYREVVFISVIAEHMVQLLNLSYRFGNFEPEEDHVRTDDVMHQKFRISIQKLFNKAPVYTSLDRLGP